MRQGLRTGMHFCGILLALSLPPATPAAPPFETLIVETASGRHAFQVEVADDPQERVRGLSRRPGMPQGNGMLLDMGRVQPVTIWMGETWFPLDLLFIGADGEIVGIHEGAPPRSTEPIPFAVPVRAVLEINASLVKELEIRDGDRVRHRVFAPP